MRIKGNNGTIIDVPESVATGLISGGHATAVDEAPVDEAPVDPPNTRKRA